MQHQKVQRGLLAGLNNNAVYRSHKEKFSFVPWIFIFCDFLFANMWTSLGVEGIQAFLLNRLILDAGDVKTYCAVTLLISDKY